MSSPASLSPGKCNAVVWLLILPAGRLSSLAFQSARRPERPPAGKSAQCHVVFATVLMQSPACMVRPANGAFSCLVRLVLAVQQAIGSAIPVEIPVATEAAYFSLRKVRLCPGLRMGAWGSSFASHPCDCRRWGDISAHLRGKGITRPVVDAILAATSFQHDLVLVTRNVRDYGDLGVTVPNPWETA